MATVLYFIPEDGDTELEPNVYLAPRPRQQGSPPTLGQIRSSFPLPGNFFFRFKAPVAPGADRDKKPFGVWLDCINDQEPVPIWQGMVMAKVTRLANSSSGPANVANYEGDKEFGHTKTTAPPATQQPSPPALQQQQQQQQRPQPQPQVAPNPTPPQQAPVPDLFGAVFSTPQQQQSHPNSVSGGSRNGDLLGDFGSAASSRSGSYHGSDFLGMTAPSASSYPTPPQQQQQQQPYPPQSFAPQQQQQRPPNQSYPSQQQQQQQRPPAQQKILHHSSSGGSAGTFGDLAGNWEM